VLLDLTPIIAATGSRMRCLRIMFRDLPQAAYVV
jgi:hypothetical protein